MRDSLSLPRHVTVDRIVQYISHSVSMLATLDAAKLSHDEELESTHLKLQRLEGELKDQKKLNAELQTVAREVCSQAEAYEARMVNFESEIASRDVTIAELRRAVNELEQGHVDFESDLFWDKVEVLWLLSNYHTTSSKREEAFAG